MDSTTDARVAIAPALIEVWRALAARAQAQGVEQTFTDMLQQLAYLKREVVSLRASALTAAEDKASLARELQARIVALATDKADLERQLSEMAAHQHRTTTFLSHSLDSGAFDRFRSASPEAVNTAGVVAQLEARLAREKEDREALEASSQALMSQMLTKLRALEDENKQLAAALEQAQTARAAAEQALASESLARERAETALAALHSRQARAIGANDEANSALRATVATLTHQMHETALERDRMRVELTRTRADLAEATLEREKLEMSLRQ